MSNRYKGQENSGLIQIFSIIIGLTMSFAMFLGNPIPFNSPVFVRVFQVPIESLHLYNRGFGIILMIAVLLNVISCVLTFKKTQGKELVLCSLTASILVVLYHIYYTLIMYGYFRCEFVFKSVFSYLYIGVGIFFFGVAIFCLRHFYRIKDKMKTCYVIPAVIAVVVGIATMFITLSDFTKEKGYTNYLNDRFPVNVVCENDQFNSMNQAVVIGDNVYCIARPFTTGAKWEILKISKDGSTEVLDSSDFIVTDILVNNGNDIYYRKEIRENEYALCVLNVVTGNINVHTADEVSPEYERVINDMNSMFGVRDNKLFFNAFGPEGGVWTVELTDGDIDISSLEKYAWDTMLAGYDTTCFYNMFIHGQNYGDYHGSLVVDGRAFYKEYYATGSWGIVSYDYERGYNKNSCDHIENISAFNVYNGKVYYVKYEESSYHLYRADLDFSSQVLIGEFTAPEDEDAYINLIVSDTYIVFINGNQIETIELD